MRATIVAALASILLAAADGGRHQSEVRPNRGWSKLVGKWKIVADEGPDGKRVYGNPVDPYLTIRNDQETGDLTIRLRGSRDDGIWDKLEVDADKRPNLYWVHVTTVLPPLPPGGRVQGGVLTGLWDKPGVERRPDGTGVLRFYVPMVFEVDGDKLKVSLGYDVAGRWDAPDLVNAKDRFIATYYTRVRGKR